MPEFFILSPMDQPTKKVRLIDKLSNYLESEDFNEFGLIVAFAKVGPLLRLKEKIDAWKAKGRTINAYFGIDQKGTSSQALSFALSHFDNVFLTSYPGHSFHPKIYWFHGNEKAVAIIGSNNLTVGGTETNFESFVELKFNLPKEEEDFQHIKRIEASLSPDACSVTQILTAERLKWLQDNEYLLDESMTSAGTATRRLPHGAPIFEPGESPGFYPPSSVPKKLLNQSSSSPAQAQVKDMKPAYTAVSGFVIQIKVHHNGEILLSRTATKQKPDFFGMPFRGTTTPKKNSNKAYPQREPDPVCDITVFGQNDAVTLKLESYNLNTVLYETKQEIRITASPLIGVVPDYSIMVMQVPKLGGIDYRIRIYTPDSQSYTYWMGVCDQIMPGGGKAPRYFGWY